MLQFKPSNKLWFISTGISFILVLAWILWGIFLTPSFQKNFQNKVQKRFSLLFEEVESELTEIQNRQKTTQDLHTFASQATYPFFVFQEDKLIFWSAFDFVPDYEQIEDKNNWDVIEYLEKGKYLIRKQKKEDKTITVILVPLYQDYKVENTYLQAQANPDLFLGSDVQLDTYSVNPSKRILNTFKNAKNNERLDFLNLRKEFPLERKSELLGLFHTLQESQSEILSPEENFLFSFNLAQSAYQNGFNTEILVLLSLIFLALILKSTWQILLPFQKEKQFIKANLIWFGVLFLLRGLIEILNIYSLGGNEFFSYFFNILIGGIFFLPLWTFYPQWKLTKLLMTRPNPQSLLIAWGLFSGSYVFLMLFEVLLEGIQSKFAISFDLTQSLDLELPQILFLVTFIILSVFYFLFIQNITRVLLVLPLAKVSEKVLILVLGVATYALVSYWSSTFSEVILISHSLLIALVYALNLPRKLFPFKYISSIYLFLVAISCAAVGAWTIYEYHRIDELNQKVAFKNRLLEESDKITEQQLADILKKIKQERELVQGIIKDSVLDLEIFVSKFQEKYIGNYFAQYQTKVLLFDSTGKAVYGTSQSYDYFTKRYKEFYDKVEGFNEEIYFTGVLNGRSTNQYHAFATLNADSIKNAKFLIINLEKQQPIARNVYPELLAAESFSEIPKIKNYSYAYFGQDELLYNYGNFDYENDFSTRFFGSEEIVKNEFTHMGYLHYLGNTGSASKKIIISSKNYSFLEAFTNFSLLFLLLVFLILFLTLFSSFFFLSQSNRLAFSTRIQLYLVAAFFLPLFTVSITTLLIIYSSNRQDLLQKFVSQTENVSKNLISHLQDLQADKITFIELAETLEEVAQYAELDVNIFAPNGKLLLSNQPAIYIKGSVLAPYINPKAFAEIALDNKKHTLLVESTGKLNYRNVYAPIRSYKSQKLLGIVSIPFFDVNNALDEKIIEVLSIIIQIFTVLFIVFVGLSFFASNILTVPLRLIRQKLQKTNLNEENEPLDWQSDDEIGLLVQEYNQMIEKLEVSKEALARSQKETAWREMARQVAHEIKNPLTPMKLTLQLMQVKIERLDEEVQETFKRSFDTLLTQVDTLSDIATSFSSFAKMPMPVIERFEISEVLEETLQLYRTNPDVDLETNVIEGDYFVLGDRKLMGRILTNLMLNAIQAVPSELRRPIIEVTMIEKSTDKVIIEIKDNGNGIEEEIKEKIFVPNFTTKLEGSGIGLAVAKRGIEHTGGKIWFETEENIGTSFFIELPKVK